MEADRTSGPTLNELSGDRDPAEQTAPQAPFHDKLERIFDQVAQTIELRSAAL